MRITAAVDAQPVATDPLARARDDGFVAGEIRGASERVAERFREPHAREQAHDGGRTADHARQHAGVAVGIHVFAGLQQRNAADRQPGQHARDLVELVDTQRLEIVAERGFDRAFPAIRDAELRRQARLLARARTRRATRRCANPPRPQRGLLQRFERNDFGAALLTLGARRFQAALGVELRGAQLLRTIERRVERLRQLVGGAARERFLFGELRQQRRGFLRDERLALDRQAIGLRREPAQLVFELLDARALHLRGLVRGALLAIEPFPALLPVRERLFRARERLR